MDLVLPFDTNLEKHLIGCMLFDPECIVDIVDIAKPEHFYWKQNTVLCRRIYDLWDEDVKQVDLTVLHPFLEANGIDVSGVTEMVSSVASTASVRVYAERLRDLASLRESVRIGHELTQLGHLREPEEIKQGILAAETKLAKVMEMNVQVDTMKTMSEALMEFNDDFEEHYLVGSGITGLPSGFEDLDVMTAGFQDSDLIIIAARPSMGKTAFALQIADHISIDNNKPTLLFSLEMAKKSLVRRMIARTAKIDLQKMNTGLISDEEYTRYSAAIGHLGSANLVIDDQSALNVTEMKAKARRVKRERGLSCIIIDYLQLIHGQKGLSRFDLVSENTRLLKGMAREFDIPIIVLSQLSRGVEQRQDKRPMLSDLRESGQIEQDADLVMFLYRDEYYNAETDKKNIVEIILAKQRNGPIGKVELLFLKQYNHFHPLKRRSDEVGPLEGF